MRTTITHALTLALALAFGVSTTACDKKDDKKADDKKADEKKADEKKADGEKKEGEGEGGW